MNVSEQINAQIRILRSLSFECHCQWKEELEFALSEAANTIESISAKLADMERSAEDCGSGWILCSKQFPEEGKEILLQDHYGNLEIAKFGHNAFYQCGFYNGDWFSTANNYLAWQPLPEPYRES